MTRGHGLGALPWTVLGYRKDGRPIYPIAGGAPDDEDIDTDMDGGDDEDSDDDEDESDDEDEGDGKPKGKGKDGKPDGDEDEDEDEPLGDAGKKALEREREKNKRLRRELREAKKGKESPDEAEQKAEAKWKPAFVRERASSALREAGLIGKPDRLLRLLDMDALDVDVDDDGSVDIDGLDDQIAELRTDYPALFRKKGGSSIDARDRGDDRLGRNRTERRSATQIQADALLGRG